MTVWLAHAGIHALAASGDVGREPMRITTRRAMISVAIVAVVLAVLVQADRALRSIFPRTPAEWAWNESARWRRPSIGIDEESRSRWSRRYAEIARAFERRNERWADSTPYTGPFTNGLRVGERIVLGQDAIAKSTERGAETPLASRIAPPWSVGEGATGIVVKDWIIDDDSCSDSREVLVRLDAGDHAGQLALIERIYLRRPR